MEGTKAGGGCEGGGGSEGGEGVRAVGEMENQSGIPARGDGRDPGSGPRGPGAPWPQYLAGNSEQLGSKLNECYEGVAS